jgi:predicted lysophospholipase L1 biosynthesis ABC-type transport system permease subunit
MLALAGVHGVLSHFVQQSRRVFGIRQALGATRARIVAAVVGWVLMPVVVGVAAGGAVSAAAVRLIESLLFGISPDDPSTAFVVSAVVTIVALATVLPAAVRASRGDITASLRQP